MVGAKHPAASAIKNINERIEKHVRLFSLLSKQIKQLGVRIVIEGKIDGAINCCSHDLVKLFMKKMEQDCSIDAVIETWHVFNNCYQDIEPELFLREFSAVVCAVSQECASALASLPQQKKIEEDEKPAELSVSLNDIVQLYLKISSLPIADILISMDILYESLVELMEDYGLQPEQSWQEWVTLNWWIPPVVVTGLVLSLVKHHHYRIISGITRHDNKP